MPGPGPGRNLAPTDYSALAEFLLGTAQAPARAFMAQAPKAPSSLGLLGDIHNAIDPVQAFGGYGGLMAMALPPGTGKLRAMPKPKSLPKDIEIKTIPNEFGGLKVQAIHTPTGKEIGYVRYRPAGDDFNWIDGMAVREDFQRKGINSAMMDTIKGHKAFAHTSPEGEAFLQGYAKKRGKDDLSWGPGG